MTYEKILSLDPGGSTGWALFQAHHRAIEPGAKAETTYNRPSFRYGVIAEDEHHSTLWKLIDENAPDIVLCEEFVYQRRKVEKGVSLELVSREYIGVAKLWCQQSSRPFELTRLSELAFWSDTKLKQVGCWSSSVHSRDATRHLLWWLSFKFNNPTWINKLK